MSNKPEFFKCMHCGNMVGMIKSSGAKIICCGDPMTELVPNSTEAAVEKHIPVIEKQGEDILVKVGSVEHPMTEEHFIEWICVMTETTTIRVRLEPGMKPQALIKGISAPATVYAYCNLHGLWKAEI